MPVEATSQTWSFIAGADLRTSQFKCVKMSGANIVAGTAAASCVGILQDKPNNGQVGQVMTAGVSKAVCAAAGVAAGVNVSSDATGCVVVSGATDPIVGTALEVGAGGDIISVLLK